MPYRTSFSHNAYSQFGEQTFLILLSVVNGSLTHRCRTPWRRAIRVGVMPRRGGKRQRRREHMVGLLVRNSCGARTLNCEMAHAPALRHNGVASLRWRAAVMP